MLPATQSQAYLLVRRRDLAVEQRINERDKAVAYQTDKASPRLDLKEYSLSPRTRKMKKP
jgi:hypothetical protein